VKFARLVEEVTVDDAADAVRVAERIGFDRVWLIEGRGADPRMVVGAVNAGRLRLVLVLDPAADNSVPPGLPLELAVAQGSGWLDGLRAMLDGASYDPAPPAWVMADDVGTVAAAARSGVGAAIPALGSPEDAEQWAAEYEAELAADSAAAAGGTVNAALAVVLPAGDDAGELVGMIERYRQCGVDEVILGGEKAGDRDFMERVIGEFDDDEVRDAVAATAARRAPLVERIEQRAQPKATAAQAAASPPRRRPKRLAARAQAMQQAAVRRMSDRQLEIVVGNRLGVRALFAVTARMYRPSKAGGFSGPIEFTLTTPHGPETWTIDCSPAGATTRRAAAPDAKLRVDAKLADFLRVGVGEVNAPSAVLAGKLNIRGDFGLALKMGEMFGGPSLTG
jgi:hypothetical protein